jgi:maltokinase
LTESVDGKTLGPIWDQLLDQIAEQRWFADKQRRAVRIDPVALFWIRKDLPAVVIAVVDVLFEQGGQARYQMPLGVRAIGSAPSPGPPGPAAVISGGDPGRDLVVCDALADPEMAALLLEHLTAAGTIAGEPRGTLSARVLRPGLDLGSSQLPARPLSLEQSNSLVVFDERLVLKVFRRLWPGVNPELQLLEALDGAGFSGVAAPWLAVECAIGDETHSLGMLQSYLRNGSDGFTMALTSLRDLQADLTPDADGEVPTTEQCDLAVISRGGSFLGAARELGSLTARMHLALSDQRLRVDLRARPLQVFDLMEARHRIEDHLDLLLRETDPRLEPLRVHRARLRILLEAMANLAPSGMAIRAHGDLHLGQVLRTDEGWHILDFEGRPAVPVEERSAHVSPLLDVAGMLRSFDYAAAVALRQQVDPDEPSARTLAPYGRSWARLTRQDFLLGYYQEEGIQAVAGPQPEMGPLLAAFEIGQALYEVQYELRTRPEWLTIPLEGIARLVHEVQS